MSVAGHSNPSTADGQVDRSQQGSTPAVSHPPGSGGTPLHCCGHPSFCPQGLRTECRFVVPPFKLQTFWHYLALWRVCPSVPPHTPPPHPTPNPSTSPPFSARHRSMCKLQAHACSSSCHCIIACASKLQLWELVCVVLTNPAVLLVEGRWQRGRF